MISLYTGNGLSIFSGFSARSLFVSTVMSISAGHHVMHLPHPTHPDASN
jgi:hypothetical protein